MDPDANLREQRRLSAKILGQIDRGVRLDLVEVMMFASYVNALDDWIGRGGALPSAWRRWNMPITVRRRR